MSRRVADPAPIDQLGTAAEYKTQRLTTDRLSYEMQGFFMPQSTGDISLLSSCCGAEDGRWAGSASDDDE